MNFSLRVLFASCLVSSPLRLEIEPCMRRCSQAKRAELQYLSCVINKFNNISLSVCRTGVGGSGPPNWYRLCVYGIIFNQEYVRECDYNALARATKHILVNCHVHVPDMLLWLKNTRHFDVHSSFLVPFRSTIDGVTKWQRNLCKTYLGKVAKMATTYVFGSHRRWRCGGTRQRRCDGAKENVRWIKCKLMVLKARLICKL